MIDAHRDYGDETTIVDDIEHLDFDPPCARHVYGCQGFGEIVVRIDIPGCPTHNTRWLMCGDCATKSGQCKCCGLPGSYVIEASS